MYKIYFYRDKNGNRPVYDYILKLASNKDKDSRIKFNKIQDYIKALKEIFFVAWNNDSFILLHQFIKKTQKTPSREIEKAKRELADLIERGVEDE